MANSDPPYLRVLPVEVERAQEAASHEDALLERVSDKFLGRFGSTGLLINEFTLLPQIDVGFRAYIFFASDAEVAACQSSGLKKEMREFLATELQALDSEEDLLALEIDSYENIVRQFEGNYFLRLRSADVQERGKRH